MSGVEGSGKPERVDQEGSNQEKRERLYKMYIYSIYICVFRFVASVSDLDWKLFSFKPTPRFLAGL